MDDSQKAIDDKDKEIQDKTEEIKDESNHKGELLDGYSAMSTDEKNAKMPHYAQKYYEDDIKIRETIKDTNEIPKDDIKEHKQYWEDVTKVFDAAIKGELDANWIAEHQGQFGTQMENSKDPVLDEITSHTFAMKDEEMQALQDDIAAIGREDTSLSANKEDIYSKYGVYDPAEPAEPDIKDEADEQKDDGLSI